MIDDEEEFWTTLWARESGGPYNNDEMKAIVYYIAGRYGIKMHDNDGDEISPAELVARITQKSNTDIGKTIRAVWADWPEECRLPA